MKRVVVTGGTGFVGRALVEALLRRGDRVTVFSRDPATVARAFGGRAGGVAWGDRAGSDAAQALEHADAVVNLAGEPAVGTRWTEARKQQIAASRIQGTARLVGAMAEASRPPPVLISASGVGYYGARGDEPCDESAAAGSDFLARVCVEWEGAARGAEASGTRVVLARLGIVLDAGGGALDAMALPFRLGVGGPIGSGAQWVSWVHRADVVAALLLALDDDRARGPLNVVAPEAVRQRDLARAIGRTLRRPCWLPVPALALRARFGEGAEPLLTGQRVVPAALSALGFRHEEAGLDGALARSLAPPVIEPRA